MALAERRRKERLKKKHYKDFVHTGSGTLAGRYMRCFWHPVYRAQDLLPGQAKPIRIMSEEFTLYRGEGGRPHVVAFRCAHRGTQLSVGWVEEDCIRCMYHGWKYDGTGQCVEQPAEEKSFAKKISIQSYPTEEYLGLIFAYLGEGKAPPLPRYPDFEKEDVLEVRPVLLWPCNYFQRLENNGDTFHIPFVHRGAYSAVNMRAGLPQISRKESKWGTTSHAIWPSGAINVYQLGMPNIFHFKIPSAQPEIPVDERMIWIVPLDDEHSMQFDIRLLPCSKEEAKRYKAFRDGLVLREDVSVPMFGARILAGTLQLQGAETQIEDKNALINLQDYLAQVGQGAIADREHEHLGRSDKPVILFRKLWEREFRALAEGRPLKKWTRSPGLRAEHNLPNYS